MGVAAYNRGSKAISDHISREARPIEFQMMDMLNALPKYADAGTPFGPIHFVFSHGGCWAECPRTGFGYHYKTLHEAVKRWNVVVVGFSDGAWLAVVAS